MTVHLTPELERLVRKKVQKDRYASASEVVREALRFFVEKHDVVTFRRQDLRREIDRGLASLRRRKAADGEAVFARLDAKLAALQKRSAA